jgi:hypothetical protein
VADLKILNLKYKLANFSCLFAGIALRSAFHEIQVRTTSSQPAVSFRLFMMCDVAGSIFPLCTLVAIATSSRIWLLTTLMADEHEHS